MKLEEEEILRECIAEMQEKRESMYHRFKNGWMSTSKNVPEVGQIFTYVKEGPIVKFSVDGRSNKEGILSSINYSPNTGKYTLGVFCYEYTIMGESKEVKKYSVSTSFLPGFEFEKFDW